MLQHEHIAVFYESVRPALYASLRQHKLATEDIEDVVQEAFLRLMVRFPENLLADNVRSWLFRVTYNLAIDILRSRWKSVSDMQANFDSVMSLVPDDRLNPEERYLFAERRRRLQEELAILSPRQRQAISLWITGLTCMEIAAHLKSTTHGVEELIRRGFKRLQRTYVGGKRLHALNARVTPG
jgi:RNA polymerase sigma-70 factor (ECF subfamily)